MPQAHIGVIGGSGLYRMEGMSDVEEIAVQTPFGDPSDVITVGKVEGVSMAFLPRHGDTCARQHLGAQKPGSRMGDFGQRSGQSARAYRPA